MLTRRRAALDRAVIRWAVSLLCLALLWLVTRLMGGIAASTKALLVQLIVGASVVATGIRAAQAFRVVSVWNTRVNRINEARRPWCGYPRAGLLSWAGCPECGMEPRVENL